MVRKTKTEVFAYTPEEEVALDREVDTGVFTYDDARRRMGIKAVRTDFDVSSPTFSIPGDHKPASQSVAHGPQHGDGAAIENGTGVPDYYTRTPRDVELSGEQLGINAAGVEKTTAVLDEVNKQRIDKLRKDVSDRGENPDAAEAAFRARLAKGL